MSEPSGEGFSEAQVEAAAMGLHEHGISRGAPSRPWNSIAFDADNHRDALRAKARAALTAAGTVPDLTELVRSENAQMIEVIESMHGRLREAEALLRRWVECVARGRTNAQNVLHDETEAWL